jgi:hypothetical protein
MRGEVMPSIQGVIGDIEPKTPKARAFGFARKGNRTFDKEDMGQWGERTDHGIDKATSEIDFSEKTMKGSRRAKRDSLRLPMMLPLLAAPPKVHRSYSSPDTPTYVVGSRQGQRSNGTDGHTHLTSLSPSRNGDDHADQTTSPNTRSSRAPYSNASRGGPTNTPVSHDKRRPSENNERAEDGWDLVSLEPSTFSSAVPTGTITPHYADTASDKSQHSRSAKLNVEYVDPDTASLSDDVDLRASEVLEHLESHLLSGGWREAVYRQHEQYTASTVSLVTTGKKDMETGSVRSWRDRRRNRSKTLQRPRSEQAPPPSIAAQVKASLSRQEPGGGTPVVPARHVSRPAGVSAQKKAEAEEESALTAMSKSLRRKEKSSRAALAPGTDAIYREPGKVISCVVDLSICRRCADDRAASLHPKDLPFHLRPLPPVPDTIPSKSSLLPDKISGRLRRSKRPSSATASPRSTSPLSVADITSPLSPDDTGSTASSAGLTSPKSYPRLIPRDEPSAALGQRSNDMADRRNGLTALSFLAISDRELRSASAKSSMVSISPDQFVMRPANAAPRESFESSESSSGGYAVAHILPPAELSKIGQDRDDNRILGDESLPTEDDQGSIGVTADDVVLPTTRSRQRGPVVPPRKITTRSTSLGPEEAMSPTSLSPLPRPRMTKTSTPDFGPTWTRRSQPSALTLPTIDRPATMGGWSSPTAASRPDTPDTPSPVKSCFDHDELRIENGYYGSVASVPVADDADFGTRSGSNSTTGSLYGPLNDDHDDGPGLTPHSHRAPYGDDHAGSSDGHCEPLSYAPTKDSPMSPVSPTTPTASPNSRSWTRWDEDEGRVTGKHPSLRHTSDELSMRRQEDREHGSREHEEAAGEEGSDELSVGDREIMERARAKEALRAWLGSKPRRAGEPGVDTKGGR